MKTTALRLHGKMDLRLETFDLPETGDDEILAEVICDSICMSSYKAVRQGAEHKRVPANIADEPIIIGHEFAGRLLKVGRHWQDKYAQGENFAVQPALNSPASLHRPGYSFPTLGGDSTHVLLPAAIIETGCLLRYEGDAYFMASLSEPMSCIIGACKAQYHVDMDTYAHRMGIRAGGRTALLASGGPMGLGLLDFLLHGPRSPSLVAVTDINPERLERARNVLRPDEARARGIELVYLNAGETNPVQELMDLSHGGGYDDVFVLAPLPELLTQADALLAQDGCLNFFAGPSAPDFSARINFYNVHYAGTHLVGTSGGNVADMRDALDLMARGKINPAIMITHVGGITAAREATLNLPHLPGGKKLIYTHIAMAPGRHCGF
ncbi:MAG: zinc-binding dehydrogenase [Desulfobacterales bacterium]|nr:MAG: zinc-binding dehydrogenase [Desulfobacterales bacterium]